MNTREMTELAIGVYSAMQKPAEFKALLDLVITRPHETILEIGSGRGGSLWAWSHLPTNKTVISIDLPGGDFGGGLSDDDRERVQNWIDKDQNTILCSGDSKDPKIAMEVTDALKECGDGFVDFLFIDGDHTYEGVKADFSIWSKCVRPGGLIALHDICDHSETAPTCQVKKFWDEIKTGYEAKEFISEPANWGGIGVIEWPR